MKKLPAHLERAIGTLMHGAGAWWAVMPRWKTAACILKTTRGTGPAMLATMFDHLEELEEIQAEVRRVIAMLRENEQELKAEGFDVEGSIAEIQDQFVQTVKTYIKLDQAQDEYLHACADLGEAEAEYLQSLCALMDPLASQNPEDPLSQKWQQLRPLFSGKAPINN